MKDQSIKQILLNSLKGGAVICVISSLIATIWAYGSWLWEAVVVVIAVIGFIGGTIISLITVMLAIKFGKVAASIFVGTVLLVALISLFIGYF